VGCRKWESVANFQRAYPQYLEGSIQPGRKNIVSGGFDKTIKIWNVEDGSLVRTLNGHTEAVVGLAISPMEKQLPVAAMTGPSSFGSYRPANSYTPWRAAKNMCMQ
jgi:WD40 repeat protein